MLIFRPESNHDRINDHFMIKLHIAAMGDVYLVRFHLMYSLHQAIIELIPRYFLQPNRRKIEEERFLHAQVFIRFTTFFSTLLNKFFSKQRLSCLGYNTNIDIVTIDCSFCDCSSNTQYFIIWMWCYNQDIHFRFSLILSQR